LKTFRQEFPCLIFFLERHKKNGLSRLFYPKPRLPSLVSFVHETVWSQPALLAVATGCALPPDAKALLPEANAALPLDATFDPQAVKKNTLRTTIAIRIRVFFI
jgi:hypothetical protein